MEKICSRCGKSMFDCQCRPMTIAELEQEVERERDLLFCQKCERSFSNCSCKGNYQIDPIPKNKTEVEVMIDNKDQREKLEKSIASKTVRLIELALDGEENAFMQVLAGQIVEHKKELARIDQVIIKPVFSIKDINEGDVYFIEAVCGSNATRRLFIEVNS